MYDSRPLKGAEKSGVVNAREYQVPVQDSAVFRYIDHSNYKLPGGKAIKYFNDCDS